MISWIFSFILLDPTGLEQKGKYKVDTEETCRALETQMIDEFVKQYPDVEAQLTTNCHRVKEGTRT